MALNCIYDGQAALRLIDNEQINNILSSFSSQDIWLFYKIFNEKCPSIHASSALYHCRGARHRFHKPRCTDTQTGRTDSIASTADTAGINIVVCHHTTRWMDTTKRVVSFALQPINILQPENNLRVTHAPKIIPYLAFDNCSKPNLIKNGASRLHCPKDIISH